MDFAPSEGAAVMTTGAIAIWLIAAKSFSGS